MLKKSYNRNREIKYLLFSDKKKVKKIVYTEFLKKNKIHDIIKFPRNEFKFLEKKKNFFTHFNIHKTIHKKGKKYLIIKIYKKGFFDNREYVHPVLDCKKFILVKCMFSKNHIKYNNLKKKDFRFSLKTIKNVSDLKKKILLRYKFTMGKIKKKDKLNLGVAITRLKILKIVTPNLLNRYV